MDRVFSVLYRSFNRYNGVWQTAETDVTIDAGTNFQVSLQNSADSAFLADSWVEAATSDDQTTGLSGIYLERMALQSLNVPQALFEFTFQGYESIPGSGIFVHYQCQKIPFSSISFLANVYCRLANGGPWVTVPFQTHYDEGDNFTLVLPVGGDYEYPAGSYVAAGQAVKNFPDYFKLTYNKAFFNE
jgi:hypothetical protein